MVMTPSNAPVTPETPSPPFDCHRTEQALAFAVTPEGTEIDELIATSRELERELATTKEQLAAERAARERAEEAHRKLLRPRSDEIKAWTTEEERTDWWRAQYWDVSDRSEELNDELEARAEQAESRLKVAEEALERIRSWLNDDVSPVAREARDALAAIRGGTPNVE